MRRAQHQLRDPAAPATTHLPEVDPALRDEPDPDPLVEAMVQRLRENLSALVALDEWGRPVPWRSVVRVALGPTLADLRDAQTAAALATAVIRLPAGDETGTTGAGTAVGAVPTTIDLNGAAGVARDQPRP